jgi:hypothetical protein
MVGRQIGPHLDHHQPVLQRHQQHVIRVVIRRGPVHSLRRRGAGKEEGQQKGGDHAHEKTPVRNELAL